MNKEIRTIQDNYILSCINNEEESLSTPVEKLQYFVNTLKNEYYTPWNKRNYKTLHKLITEYLQGLPSCCNCDYTNHRIIEIGKLWGYCKTEKQESKFVECWFSELSFLIIQLCRKHKIEIEKV